jgi:hypothetical protein
MWRGVKATKRIRIRRVAHVQKARMIGRMGKRKETEAKRMERSKMMLKRRRMKDAGMGRREMARKRMGIGRVVRCGR